MQRSDKSIVQTSWAPHPLAPFVLSSADYHGGSQRAPDNYLVISPSTLCLWRCCRRFASANNGILARHRSYTFFFFWMWICCGDWLMVIEWAFGLSGFWAQGRVHQYPTVTNHRMCKYFLHGWVTANYTMPQWVDKNDAFLCLTFVFIHKKRLSEDENVR